MHKIAYFDCFSGASGDMLLAALLDAGLDWEAFRADLARLDLVDYDVSLVQQVRHGIRGHKFDVTDRGAERPARNLASVQQIIARSQLPETVAESSLRVFTRLAEAEASVHGTTVHEVHFHEVGAVDALVDIVGFCLAVHRLGLESLYVSPLPMGSGAVRSEHGWLPVPAPATLALLAQAGTPVIPSGARGELVTPTGAAILGTLASFAQPMMVVRAVGYGFGSKEFPWPNLLRVWIGEEVQVQGPAGLLRRVSEDGRQMMGDGREPHTHVHHSTHAPEDHT